MSEVSLGQKAVTRKRSFVALEAIKESATLRVSYKEEILVDGEVVKSENKSYSRDYGFWEASELGVAILAMIGLDLEQEDPSAPRTTE